MPLHKKRPARRINKVRRSSNPEFYSGLQQIIRQLDIVQAVVVCASEMLRNQSADYDREIAILLQRCASDRLHDQIEALTKMINPHNSDKRQDGAGIAASP